LAHAALALGRPDATERLVAMVEALAGIGAGMGPGTVSGAAKGQA
jgi:hypothetical protein